MPPSGAVVIGGYINALGIIRSLSARGIPTAIVTTETYDIAHYSNCMAMRESVIGRENQPEAITEILESRSSSWRGWAVIPTIDPAIEALARHHDRLSSKYRLITAPPDAARCLLDKTSMLEAARAVGIDLPQCYGSADSTSTATTDFRFPVIVKPVSTYAFSKHFGRKLLLARDMTEFAECVAKIETAQLACRVFDFIPGGDDRIYVYCVYINARGEPMGGLTVRKIRQSPPLFGVARVAEITEDIPQLRHATIELLRSIGFRGMAAAEFKFDQRDGSFRFLEVNGRSVLYNGLLRQAGLDLAGMAWSDRMEHQNEFARPNGWSGVWVNLHADLLYSALRRREQPLSWGDFVAPYTRPMIEAVWTREDRRPFFVQWGRTIRAASGLARSNAR